MGCVYSDFEGRCQMYYKEITNGILGLEDGYCICEDDPDPGHSCESYESDDEEDYFDDEDEWEDTGEHDDAGCRD